MGGPSREERHRKSYEVGRLIARCRRLVWTAADRELAERGESMQMWHVLNELARRGPRNQKEIAQALAQHPAGICRLLEELESKAFVTQERDPKDRRRSVVTLTAKGREWVEGLRPAVGDGFAEVLEVLSASELDSLRALLTKISVAAEQEAAPPAKVRGAR